MQCMEATRGGVGAVLHGATGLTLHNSPGFKGGLSHLKRIPYVRLFATRDTLTGS